MRIELEFLFGLGLFLLVMIISQVLFKQQFLTESGMSVALSSVIGVALGICIKQYILKKSDI